MPARSSKARKDDNRDMDARRAGLRESIDAHPEVNRKEGAGEGSKGTSFRDMEFPDTDSEDSREGGERQRRRREDEGDSSMSSDDEEFQPPSDDENHQQSKEYRERELRSKLLRAKASRRS